mmetsp:Transcript_75885/g.227777  ORF Transcript_75885/g.227777 Transcript_75885/m.227777 type:complete len:278 (+) Transcript_75885:598-1431(+)
MAGALWLMICAFHLHKRWRAYELFVQMHAPAIDKKIAGGSGNAVVHRQRILIASVEVLRCQRERDKSPCNVLRYFRLLEARNQLRYVLMRDRFVRIPLHPWTDETPGDDFDMHMYMLHICCEHVRRALELSLPGWLSLVAMLIPSFELAAYHPHGEPFLTVALGVLLVLTEIALQYGLAFMLKVLVEESPLLGRNKLHIPHADPREKNGRMTISLFLPICLTNTGRLRPRIRSALPASAGHGSKHCTMWAPSSACHGSTRSADSSTLVCTVVFGYSG